MLLAAAFICLNIDKQASENDKEALSMRVDDKDSPVADGSDFFVKVSSRRLQKKQQCINSDEGNDDTCSPSKHVPSMQISSSLRQIVFLSP
ncbi:hypothetical protein CK203_012531 [Vitis vinifera]|uniref:Uncharacterized protein n=1 Tax=Vitis vinifera TaxID=29760 RepID=A0A438KMT0_VITVI|nr:hypothetical protein CK203_071726 [Vitis vinifera]RVX22506.1 hypothetical protein CK203_012531 [Vitis vinifera]